MGAVGGVGWGVSSTVKNSFISPRNLCLSRKVSHFSPFLSFQNGNCVPNGALIQERTCIPKAAVLSSFSEDNPLPSPCVPVRFFSSTHAYLSSFLASFSQSRSGPFPPPGGTNLLMLPGMQRLWMEAQIFASKSLLRDQLGSLGLENIQRPLKMG